MKIHLGLSDVFMSPVTGKLASWTMLPALDKGYIWEGGKDNEPFPSPSMIETKLDIKNIKYDIDDIYDTAFVLQYPDPDFPRAVTLTEMAAGARLLKENVSTDVSFVLTTDWYGTLNLTPPSYLSPGTVTSISTGRGLTGGPITTSGTISIADNPELPGSLGVGLPGGPFSSRPTPPDKIMLRYTKYS